MPTINEGDITKSKLWLEKTSGPINNGNRGTYQGLFQVFTQGGGREGERAWLKGCYIGPLSS